MFNTPRARDLHDNNTKDQLANTLARAEQEIEKLRNLANDWITKHNIKENKLNELEEMLAAMKENAAALNEEQPLIHHGEFHVDSYSDYCDCGETTCPICFKN